MRLVDTSAWIEWLIASPVGTIVAREVPERGAWLVPTIVQLERAQWLRRDAGEDNADQVIAFTATCIVAALDTGIALRAADPCATHRLATADAIVLAAAMAHGADLLTCDRHLKGLRVCGRMPVSRRNRPKRRAFPTGVLSRVGLLCTL